VSGPYVKERDFHLSPEMAVGVFALVYLATLAIEVAALDVRP